MTKEMAHLQQPVTAVARTDFACLREDLTVREALDAIRGRELGEKIVYFYVVDPGQRLSGVLPVRRLLTAPLEQKLSDIMVRRVVAIPRSFTVMEACEAFVLHKFLAFPVVDEERHIVGIVDVGFFAQEVFEMSGGAEDYDELFESIGFQLTQVRDARPLRAFRFRFPWLLATILSGTFCALLASRFELTLAKCLLLSFFLTMVLGLGESVAIQSMSVTIQALRTQSPTLAWYGRNLRREAGTAALLGLGCGVTVGLIVCFWHGAFLAGVSIGASVLLALCAACFFGLSVPASLHALKLDPKIAAGPVTLAFTDIFTLLFYFGLASWLL